MCSHIPVEAAVDIVVIAVAAVADRGIYMKKRVLISILIMLMTILMITPTFAIVKPTDDFCIADYADIFSESTENEIIEANAVLERDCNSAQIVFVTVESLDGYIAEEYALKINSEWDVKSKSEDNGILFLFAAEESKVGLVIGSDIKSTFNGYMNEAILKHDLQTSLEKGECDKAVSALIPELVNWFKGYYDGSIAHVSNNLTSETPINITRYPEYADEIEAYYDSIQNKQSKWYNSEFFYEFVFFMIGVAVYLITSSIQSIRYFHKYYNETGESKPKFRIYHIWKGPHLYYMDKKGFGGGINILDGDD